MDRRSGGTAEERTCTWAAADAVEDMSDAMMRVMIGFMDRRFQSHLFETAAKSSTITIEDISEARNSKKQGEGEKLTF